MDTVQLASAYTREKSIIKYKRKPKKAGRNVSKLEE